MPKAEKVEPVEEDLLSGIEDSDPEASGDLLDEIEDDDAEGWVPEDPGEGIEGIVTKRGTTRSDYDEDVVVPTVTFKDKDGKHWRLVGYGAVLRREILDQDPQPGDKIAAKYFGEKAVKKGKFAGRPYKHFGLLVRKTSANKTAA